MGLSRFSPRQWIRALCTLGMTLVNTTGSGQKDASATPRDGDAVSRFESESVDRYAPMRKPRATPVHRFVRPPAPTHGLELEWRYG